MANPTDSITYAQAVSDLAPRQAADPTSYGIGALDGYRLVGEGTPLATLLAGNSAPTQTPQPHVAYADWANVATDLVTYRTALKAPTGYAEGLMDTFRRFGGEHWPLEYILADIAGQAHPPAPPNPPLFNSGRPAPQTQPAIAPPFDPSDSYGNVATSAPPEFQPSSSPYFLLGDFNGVTIPGTYSFAGPGSPCTMLDGPYQGLVIPWLQGANSTPPTMIMTPMLDMYPPAVQQAVLTEHCYRGYTDFILSDGPWNAAANGYAASPAKTVAWAQTLTQQWQFRIVLWSATCPTPGVSDPYAVALKAAGCLDFYLPGKEVDGQVTGDQLPAVIDQALADVGTIPVGIHFSTGGVGCYPLGFPLDTYLAGGSTSAWSQYDGKIHLMLQVTVSQSAGQQAALAYYARQRVTLGGVGGDGNPAPNCRVHMFEVSATAELYGQMTELQGKRRSLELCWAPQGIATGFVHGVGNGVSEPDGTQISV